MYFHSSQDKELIRTNRRPRSESHHRMAQAAFVEQEDGSFAVEGTAAAAAAGGGRRSRGPSAGAGGRRLSFAPLPHDADPSSPAGRRSGAMPPPTPRRPGPNDNSATLSNSYSFTGSELGDPQLRTPSSARSSSTSGGQRAPQQSAPPPPPPGSSVGGGGGANTNLEDIDEDLARFISADLDLMTAQLTERETMHASDVLETLLAQEYEGFDEELFVLCREYLGHAKEYDRRNNTSIAFFEEDGDMDTERDVRSELANYDSLPFMRKVKIFLEHPDSGRWARVFYLVLSIVVVLACAFTVAETVPEWNPIVRPTYSTLWRSMDWVFTILLTLETGTRFIANVVDDRFGSKLQNAITFLKRPGNIADIVALLPTYIQFMLEDNGRVIAGSLRTARLLRLLKFLRRFKPIRRLVVALRRSIAGLIAPFCFLGMCLLFVASAMYYAERGDYDEHSSQYRLRDPLCLEEPLAFLNSTELCPWLESKFVSMGQSLWWGIVTMAAVGYGDFVPITSWGKAVGSVTMVSGVVFVAMPIAVIGANYTQVIEMTQAVKHQNVEDRVMRTNDGERSAKLTMPGESLVLALRRYLQSKTVDLRAPSPHTLFVIDALLEATVKELTNANAVSMGRRPPFPSTGGPPPPPPPSGSSEGLRRGASFRFDTASNRGGGQQDPASTSAVAAACTGRRQLPLWTATVAVDIPTGVSFRGDKSAVLETHGDGANGAATGDHAPDSVTPPGAAGFNGEGWPLSPSSGGGDSIMSPRSWTPGGGGGSSGAAATTRKMSRRVVMETTLSRPVVALLGSHHDDGTDLASFSVATASSHGNQRNSGSPGGVHAAAAASPRSHQQQQQQQQVHSNAHVSAHDPYDYARDVVAGSAATPGSAAAGGATHCVAIYNRALHERLVDLHTVNILSRSRRSSAADRVFVPTLGVSQAHAEVIVTRVWGEHATLLIPRCGCSVFTVGRGDGGEETLQPVEVLDAHSIRQRSRQHLLELARSRTAASLEKHKGVGAFAQRQRELLQEEAERSLEWDSAKAKFTFQHELLEHWLQMERMPAVLEPGVVLQFGESVDIGPPDAATMDSAEVRVQGGPPSLTSGKQAWLRYRYGDNSADAAEAPPQAPSRLSVPGTPRSQPQRSPRVGGLPPPLPPPAGMAATPPEQQQQLRSTGRAGRSMAAPPPLSLDANSEEVSADFLHQRPARSGGLRSPTLQPSTRPARSGANPRAADTTTTAQHPTPEPRARAPSGRARSNSGLRFKL